MPPEPIAARSLGETVLVVEDSLRVRTLVANLLVRRKVEEVLGRRRNGMVSR